MEKTEYICAKHLENVFLLKNANILSIMFCFVLCPIVYVILGHQFEHVGLMLSLQRRGLLEYGELRRRENMECVQLWRMLCDWHLLTRHLFMFSFHIFTPFFGADVFF